ncbi:MAG: hypothetical protein JWQ98_1332 [Chlorobi bacterium]|nr:hypothetical protein [Chlorobiota bacterium]
METTERNNRYGAVELKRVFNRNLVTALALSLLLHGGIIGYLLGSSPDRSATGRIALGELPRPSSDTTSIPITLMSLNDKQGGGGDPTVKTGPVGPSMKGHRDAQPDPTKNTIDPKRSVRVDVPTKIRPVQKQPEQTSVAGLKRDSSKTMPHIVGSTGDPNGKGKSPALGPGGPGVGILVGSATGLGNRGWVVRPRATYPSGMNATGTVMLRFTVLPTGDIVGITPVKRADEALVRAAISGLSRAKARPLPDNVPQIAQTATIPFEFSLR